MRRSVNRMATDIMRQARHKHEVDNRSQWFYIGLIGLASVAILVGSLLPMWPH